MQKKDYIDIYSKKFEGRKKEIMLNQIDNFFELEERYIKKPKYNIGDSVVLKKDTYMHGFTTDLKVLEILATSGLINQDFLEEKVHFINYCASLWHIKKTTKLSDYIINYSGMSVRHKDRYWLVPYKKLDDFIESIRKESIWEWHAEDTMETRFMPSLSKDSRQLAIIINGREKVCKQLFEVDLLSDTMNINDAKLFMNFKNKEREEKFEKNRQFDEMNRIAYVVFGVPKNLIEGVLVGRKYEKNKKILEKIKQLLPDCYICNLDGVVIK